MHTCIHHSCAVCMHTSGCIGEQCSEVPLCACCRCRCCPHPCACTSEWCAARLADSRQYHPTCSRQYRQYGWCECMHDGSHAHRRRYGHEWEECARIDIQRACTTTTATTSASTTGIGAPGTEREGRTRTEEVEVNRGWEEQQGGGGRRSSSRGGGGGAVRSALPTL